MAAYHAEFQCDLAKPSRVIALPHVFAAGDHRSHVFQVLAYDSEDPDAGLLEGEVTGIVVTPAKATVYIEGTKAEATERIALPDGRIAQATRCSITLPQACFALPGQLMITIRLVNGDDQTAVFMGRGTVILTQTDTIIDPGDVVPDFFDLIAIMRNAAGYLWNIHVDGSTLYIDRPGSGGDDPIQDDGGEVVM